ncbi:hypothetical protein [Pseudomonas brassicacearum]|uniref:hypothetical protein n=1 Tax=Pseudomonas brassicacearum TaxID=930166 RepID=UPI00135CD4FC|nr:hypothetical protein [Pseudomonas brassicacearum]
MQSFSISADWLPAELPLFCAGPAVDQSTIRQRQHYVEAVVVLLVSKTGSGQPAIKALHGLSLHALLVALRVWLATFAATVPTAARIANVFTDELAAAHAVAAIFNVVLEEAHAFTS